MASIDVPRLNGAAWRSLLSAAANARTLRARHLGPRLRERLIVHVSAINACVVCAAIHSVLGRLVGVTTEELRCARHAELPADERTAVALRYAELRTRREEQEHAGDVARFAELFTEEEQREVRSVVDLFTFANRFNNSWEGALPGAAARRRYLGLRGYRC